jgi:hypothetical protein
MIKCSMWLYNNPFNLCLSARDYKLHPCDLPFRSFYKRSILLQAKLVLRTSQ